MTKYTVFSVKLNERQTEFMNSMLDAHPGISKSDLFREMIDFYETVVNLAGKADDLK
ncbi:MAG: hypothetical protein PHI40_07245 [Caldisericia bacterium]|nr:hypothetical protein [Caldisericia bacterium]